MKYLTKSLMQRFMSYMSEQLCFIQETRYDIEEEITYYKGKAVYPECQMYLYSQREYEANKYKKASKIQTIVKRVYACNFCIPDNYLQKMEKVVTAWINDAEWQKYYAHQDNRYDTFYRNKTKQAKQRLAKLVELQQAIRKQKSISGDSF